ncbi:unnamed protein product [Toxocara canis]|uniref:Uncharacterized protein n=1 Tax=Toxocara canis TaxID=6265 RepID=A0A183V8A8_TOXCA|nr:unnamed protein product [Toxocara canis]
MWTTQRVLNGVGKDERIDAGSIERDSERIVGDTSGRCAFSVESTNTVYPAITVAQQSQVMVEGNQQCLPPVVARPASFVAPVATSTSAGAVPVQFVYACDPYRQIVPVPVKVLQHPTTVPAGIPCAYPVPVISPTSADGAHHELPTLASSYPEQWANHLLYCGGTVARKEENNTQVSQAIVDSATYVSLPPIGGLQPVSTPTSVAHPILTSSCSCEQQSLPTQRSGVVVFFPSS